MTPHRVVLIVDDEDDLRELIAFACQEMGLAVHHAVNTVEARRWLDAHAPDLVILDIMMPDGNGLDLCRWIRDHSKCKDVPVIFSSGLKDEETVADAFELGAVDFIHKPFSVKALKDKISRLLDKAA